MKSAIIFALASIAMAAPTSTIEKRQLPGFGSSSGASSGLGALESLFPGIPGSSSGSSSGSNSLGGGGLIGIPGLSSITENGVTQNAGCKEYTFIFARGTTEPGNMGTVIGPPLAMQLNSLTGNKVTVQGVDYPADIAGNALLGASGGPAMAQLVKQALSQCPQTKVLLGGYSQGAMVVHNAANTLAAGQVTAAVLFGDPFKAENVGKVAGDKVKEFCHLGDPVCLNGVNGLAHITYGTDAETAAKFLVQAAGAATSS
ncbi:Cutinase [Penicillium italicum]|uniref:cutinase n=1 Tax=Penicillium italicum TaxID=40296 RepID=A0A0A2L940_PENIT|nr:Cutinase [Penicillium italicum]